MRSHTAPYGSGPPGPDSFTTTPYRTYYTTTPKYITFYLLHNQVHNSHPQKTWLVRPLLLPYLHQAWRSPDVCTYQQGPIALIYPRKRAPFHRSNPTQRTLPWHRITSTMCSGTGVTAPRHMIPKCFLHGIGGTNHHGTHCYYAPGKRAAASGTLDYPTRPHTLGGKLYTTNLCL